MDIVKYVEDRLHEINKDITDIDVDIQGNKVRCKYGSKNLTASLDHFGKIKDDLFYCHVRSELIRTINEGINSKDGKLPKSLNRYVLVKRDRDSKPIDAMGVSYMANYCMTITDKDNGPRYIESSMDMGSVYLDKDGSELKIYDKHEMPDPVFDALVSLGKARIDNGHRSINKYK